MQERDNIEIFRLLSFNERVNNELEEYVERSKHHESYFFEDPLKRFVAWRCFEVVYYRLKGLYFKVNESVGIGMVTETMHLLPLLVSKPAY